MTEQGHAGVTSCPPNANTNAMMQYSSAQPQTPLMNQHELDYQSPAVTQARADLALALRAAAHHGLSEGVCNHFSVELADGSGRVLLNPQGLLWQEVQADDIVLIDVLGQRLAGRHPVESTAMHIHSAIHRLAGKACVLGISAKKAGSKLPM
jgi:hypothetical protein